MSDLVHTFQSQLSGVMEAVIKAAIFDITRLVEESFMKEVSRSREQVETLKKRLQLSESRWKTQETAVRRCAKCCQVHASNEEGEKTPPSSENDRGLKQESVAETSQGSCELKTDALSEKERSEEQTNDTAESVEREDRKRDCILKEEALFITTDNKELQDEWTLDTEVAETSDFSSHNYSERVLQQIQEDWGSGLGQATDHEPYANFVTPYRTCYNPAQVNPEMEHMDRDMHCGLIKEEGHLQDISALAEVHCGIAEDAGHRGQSRYVGDTADDVTGGLYKDHTFSHSLELNDPQVGVNEASLKGCPLSHRTRSTRAYTGNQCGKKFTQACSLRVHQRVHQRDGLHLCSHCGKGFSSFSDLRRHRCRRKGNNPYTCTVCGNKFSRLWNLKLHRRIHMQEKPHQCTVCNKRFTRADNLKVHQRTHTGERPYCCGICGLGFKRLDHLRSHQHKHSADPSNH